MGVATVRLRIIIIRRLVVRFISTFAFFSLILLCSQEISVLAGVRAELGFHDTEMLVEGSRLCPLWNGFKIPSTRSTSLALVEERNKNQRTEDPG